MVICLRIEKTSKAKLHGVILRSTLSRIHYYQNKRLQIKESQYLIPTHSRTLTPISNWTCSVMTISHFQCTAHSTWLTTNLRRMLAVKFFSSSTRWRSRSSLLQNLTAYKRSSFFKRKMLRHMSPVTICLWKFFALSCIHLH